jgi:hypothetical protein
VLCAATILLASACGRGGASSGPAKPSDAATDTSALPAATDTGTPPTFDYTQPVLDNRAADIVLLLPAGSSAELEAQWAALSPWISSRVARGLSVVALPTSAFSAETPKASQVRDALGAALSRRGDGGQVRHLVVFSRDQLSSDAALQEVVIPRAALSIEGVEETVYTDAPYGDPWSTADLTPSTRSSPGSFAVADAELVVSRVPAASPEELAAFAQQTLAYEASAHRRDVLLAAGSITGVPGDTAGILCPVADELALSSHASAVLKVFDYDTCAPDLVPSPGGADLADFMATDDRWQGGVVYNISHGGPEGIQYLADDGYWWSNLRLSDRDLLDPSKLSVFISLSCGTGGHLSGELNLDRMLLQTGTVATVSATATVHFTPGIADVIHMEQVALPMLLDPDTTDLGSGFYAARAEYLGRAVAYPEDELPFAWSNALALQVTGDGTLAFW